MGKETKSAKTFDPHLYLLTVGRSACCELDCTQNSRPTQIRLQSVIRAPRRPIPPLSRKASDIGSRHS